VEHTHRHHLGNRSSYGRQAEGINREAIAIFLDRTPFRTDPTFAAMLNVRIGMDLLQVMARSKRRCASLLYVGRTVKSWFQDGKRNSRWSW
jgi:hypothetical protein